MDAPAAILFWRRLDAPGHDCCRLFRRADGYRLLGDAVFLEARRACHLRYQVNADRRFRTAGATVSGHIGSRPVDLRIRPGANGWELNGEPYPETAGCLDVDLGFTPATNLLPLRRLHLRAGAAADAPAAYLAFPRLTLQRLPQQYRRLSRTEYDYRSPDHGYRAVLRVLPVGAVVDYPGLFRLLNGRSAADPSGG